MKGRAHAAKIAFENTVAVGYYTAAFNGQKLKSLRHYLAPDEDRDVSPDIVLDAMMTLQAQGVPIEIRKVG